MGLPSREPARPPKEHLKGPPAEVNGGLQLARPRYARTLLVALLVITAALSSAAPSSADTLSVRAVRLEGGSLVFRLKGVVRTNAVRSARLRVGHFRRRLSARQVRRGVRRGVIKVRVP